MRADADSSEMLLSRLSRGYFLLWAGWLERLPLLLLFRPSEKGRRAAAVAIGGPAAEVRKTRVDVDTNCFRAALRSMGKPKTNNPITEEEQSTIGSDTGKRISLNNQTKKTKENRGRKQTRRKKRYYELWKGQKSRRCLQSQWSVPVQELTILPASSISSSKVPPWRAGIKLRYSNALFRIRLLTFFFLITMIEKDETWRVHSASQQSFKIAQSWIGRNRKAAERFNLPPARSSLLQVLLDFHQGRSCDKNKTKWKMLEVCYSIKWKQIYLASNILLSTSSIVRPWVDTKEATKLDRFLFSFSHWKRKKKLFYKTKKKLYVTLLRHLWLVPAVSPLAIVFCYKHVVLVRRSTATNAEDQEEESSRACPPARLLLVATLRAECQPPP